MRVLIVVGDFYTRIADQLEKGAVAALREAGVEFDIVHVPGALEIPAIIARAAAKSPYDAYVALGCVIRGETSHYDYVCAESARGLMSLAVQEKLAIGNGILTVENSPQAHDRADTNKGNKGRDAVLAALSVAAY